VWAERTAEFGAAKARTQIRPGEAQFELPRFRGCDFATRERTPTVGVLLGQSTYSVPDKQAQSERKITPNVFNCQRRSIFSHFPSWAARRYEFDDLCSGSGKAKGGN
jgi:hypothetical protein